MQMLILNMLLLFGCQNVKPTRIIIKPLHPYSASPYYYKKNETKGKNYIIKYFFIEGACKATDKVSEQVDSFVIKVIRTDTDFIDFGGYYLLFYRKTKVINENFREQINGMISYNLLDEYDNDLLFEYAWSDRNFMGCKYYKDGKVVKKIFDKGRNFLKRNPTLPLPDTEKVNLRDMR